VAHGQQAIELLRQQFPDEIVHTGSYRDQHWVEVKLERLEEICRWLRDDDSTAFDHLVDVTAVHWPDDRSRWSTTSTATRGRTDCA
jgi:NADH:ubiquinone oxidoreductase subunit C